MQKAFIWGLFYTAGKDGMLAHANGFVASGVQFTFDPGQQMPMFNSEEHLFFVDRSSWVTVNDYEFESQTDYIR